MTVPLYENFDNALGEFPNYNVYDTGQRIALGSQAHVDIRSFEKLITIPLAMLDLATKHMTVLDAMTMQQLETGNTLQPGEGWTAGTIGPQADRNNVHGISLACTTGVNTTTSFIQTSTNVQTVSLGGDYISLALPAFPLANINLASTFIDFTSGDFTAGPIASLAFSASTTTLVSGNSQATFPVSMLSAINTNAITGVRFRIQATGSCTFRCLAIRGIANSWEYAPVDKNTLYDRFQATVSPTGALGGGFTFPAAVSTGGPIPTDWPILFFADPVEEDPTPVDIEVGTAIHTGTGTGLNTYSLYLRESSLLLNEQSVLDGQTMTQLAQLQEQPDNAISPFALAPLDMYQIDGQPMSILDLDDMHHFETGNRVLSRYILVTLKWGTANTLDIRDDLGNSYSFTGLPMASLQDYYLLVTLLDNSIRAQIYPLTAQGFIEWDMPVFDSTAVIDTTFVYRRPGRFGWYANLVEGDTYLSRLRPRYVTYNEYRSLPLSTETPTEGAQLFAGATPDRQLYPGAEPTLGTTISADQTKSVSGSCLRIVTDGSSSLEGLQTPPMLFENLFESYISFDLLAPAGLRFEALLVGEFRFIEVWSEVVQDNTWHHIDIPLDQAGALVQPGPYSFFLLQTTASPQTWFVDELSIPTRSIAWAGRQAADPWLMRNPSWIPFGTTVNDPFGGILFDRGNQTQIRGRGLTQDAKIDHLKILPKYAQLGRFAWPDQEPVSHGNPLAAFGVSHSGAELILDGRSSQGFNGLAPASGSPNGIATYLWNFGDGTYAYGPQVKHTYFIPGTYTVTLTVVDTIGLTANTSAAVTGGGGSAGIASLPLVMTR